VGHHAGRSLVAQTVASGSFILTLGLINFLINALRLLPTFQDP